MEYRVGGVRRDDGSLMLDRRVICLRDDEPDGKDIAIRIEVDDAELYFGKAKYEEARDVGVIHDSRGRAFYVDALTATDSAGPS